MVIVNDVEGLVMVVRMMQVQVSVQVQVLVDAVVILRTLLFYCQMEDKRGRGDHPPFQFPTSVSPSSTSLPGRKAILFAAKFLARLTFLKKILPIAGGNDMR